MATPVSDRSGEWQQQAMCGWRDKHDVETADDACRTGKAMLGALMERKAQRGTNRACSGMIATVALPHTGQGLRRWSEHLDGDGMEIVCSWELAVRSYSLGLRPPPLRGGRDCGASPR